MVDKKTVFIAFAKENERERNLFSGQRLLAASPYEFIDYSVREPYETEWKKRVRTRILRSHGVIALISSYTPKADGQLWEITCAVEEDKPLMGVWVEQGYHTKPTAMESAPCVTWTWDAVTQFIDRL